MVGAAADFGVPSNTRPWSLGHGVEPLWSMHWSQRLCIVPDADLFGATWNGTASVVTDEIAATSTRPSVPNLFMRRSMPSTAVSWPEAVALIEPSAARTDADSARAGTGEAGLRKLILRGSEGHRAFWSRQPRGHSLERRDRHRPVSSRHCTVARAAVPRSGRLVSTCG